MFRRFIALFYNWIDIGTDGYGEKQKQRLILTNVMITVTAALTFVHALVFAVYDLEQLKIPAALSFFTSVAMLGTPYLHLIHPYLGSIFNLTVWLCFGTSLAVIFGNLGGIYFYFLAGASSAILIMGVYHNLLSVMSISCQIGLFLFFDLSELAPIAGLDLPSSFYTPLYVCSIVFSMCFILCMVLYAFFQVHKAEAALEREYAYSERLLANMLPASIAAQLKRHPGETIADSHENVTILFADIVDFTPRAQKQSPTDLVKFLNDLFTRFDELATKHQLEKIKTLGDAFMVAGGMPDHQPDHAERVAYMALDMMAATHEYAKENNEDIELRIGIHSGPAVAGVIGTKKPFYDVWGDTVNTAARLESFGTSGKIQVTADTKSLLDKTFNFTKRGKVDVKGKGTLDLWYLANTKN